VTTPLTESEVRALGEEWFRLLDEHAAEVYLLPLLVPEGLVQKWPDYDVQNLADFEGWYQRVLSLFFDEVHTLKEFKVTINSDGSKADVKVIVNWDARSWTPRAAKSKHLWMDAYQTWEVVRSPATGKAAIKTIVVDDIKVMPGADPL
jgi:hypothetical protein